MTSTQFFMSSDGYLADAAALATSFEKNPERVRIQAECYFVAGDLAETVYVPISDEAHEAILNERSQRLRAAQHRADEARRILTEAGIPMARHTTAGIDVTVGSCQANVYWLDVDSMQREDPSFRRARVTAELARCVTVLRDHGWTLGPGDRSGMHRVCRL